MGHLRVCFVRRQPYMDFQELANYGSKVDVLRRVANLATFLAPLMLMALVYILAAVQINDQFPLANGPKVVEKPRPKSQRGKMVAAKVVRGGGERELPNRAGGVKRNGLLLLQPGAEKGMVVIIPTWKVREEVMDSHREKRMRKIVNDGD